MRDTDGQWGLIGDDGAVAIANALVSNTHSKLQVLDLSRGKIGDVGARAIGEMLQDDQHLVGFSVYCILLPTTHCLSSYCAKACVEATREHDQ